MKRNVLLNPGPATTTDTVKQSLVVPDICPREQAFGLLMGKVTQKLVDVVHGKKDYTAVIYTGSGTAAIEACIISVVPDNKRIMIIDNGAYGQRMAQIASIYNIDCIHLKYPVQKAIDLESIEKIFRKNQNQISHIAIVHHETTTGILNPVTECCHIAKKYGADCIVDAMSSYAGIPIDIKKMGADYLISSSNKCIQGMAGLSFVISKIDALKKISQYPPKSLYLDLYTQYQHLKKSNQMRFTPAVQIFYALDQALNEYFEETESLRYQRYTRSYDELIKGLKQLGFKFLLPEHLHSKLLTSIIEPTNKNYSFDTMHNYLFDRDYTIYPGKSNEKDTFRIANIGQIDKDDIIEFLSVLKEYLKKYKLLDNLYK